MIKVADLPAVRAQLQRDAAAQEAPSPADVEAQEVQYARAPDGPGFQPGLGGRPAATQGSAR